tara:strand:- start:426 stop:1100 length:675 start_codon:yes stop_codon:yes gene_type:complete
MISKSLIVFGTGQQSEIISFYLKRQSRKVKFYCVDDKYFNKNKFQGINVISTSELLKKFKPQNYNLHIAISYSELNSLRSSKYNFFKKKGYKFENVTHNTNLSKIDLIIGENVVILDSFIQPKSKIGDNTFIWSGSIIGHHSDIGKHCWISSGVAIGGNCKIRDHTFFGMNSTIGHFVKIGSSCFVGAGANITKNVNNSSVVINPDSKSMLFDAKKFLKLKKFK